LFGRLLKNQLKGKLEQSRIAHFLRLSKRGVRGISICAIELRVIKQIEYLGTEFHAHFLVNRGVLKEPHIDVVGRGIAA
jgi:hypothetical protein